MNCCKPFVSDFLLYNLYNAQNENRFSARLYFISRLGILKTLNCKIMRVMSHSDMDSNYKASISYVCKCKCVSVCKCYRYANA